MYTQYTVSLNVTECTINGKMENVSRTASCQYREISISVFTFYFSGNVNLSIMVIWIFNCIFMTPID